VSALTALALVSSLTLVVRGAAPAAAANFSNATPITTTLPACGGAPAQATPYPSPITVSGLSGTVTDVNVTLTSMNNDFQGDLEVFLVGPGASPPSMVLLSDAGTGALSNTTLTLDDAAGAFLPQGGSWPPSPVTAKPTDYLELVGAGAPADTYPSAPASLGKPTPTGSATMASTFNGIAPNGVWNLYVLNDVCDAPAESINGGWSLDITTASLTGTTTTVTSSSNPSTTGQSVTFTATVTSSSVPTGTVTFTEGATTLAANVSLNGSGTATFATSTLPEGNHVITATYNGNATFATSNASVNQIVDRVTTVTGTTFCNTGPIAVRPGNAAPYPSRINVSGLTGTVATVTAQLKNVAHPFAEDIDVLLVGPATANNLKLVSDAGGGATNNVTVNFSDAAGSLIANSGAWGTSGTTISAKPTDYTPGGDVDTFPSALPPVPPAPSTVNQPAPTGSATLASAFGGSSPNGTWSLYVRDDGAPDTGSIAGGWCITLTLNQPPAITSANNTTFTTGTAGSFTVTATGTPTPTLALTGGTLPAGVTFTPATGVLSGTPAAGTGGTYPLTFTASNGVAPDATQSFTLVVNQPPAFTSPSNATFTTGAAGSFTVTATGFPAPTRSLTSGTLPAGVTFTPASGVLAGTPAAGTGGSYPLTFTAANGVAPDATQSFTLTVNQAPALTSASTTTFSVGNPGSFTVTAAGSPAPALSLTAGTLPSGVTFTPATGVLSGTPAAGTGGSYPLTFTASNGVAPDATQTFTLVINQAPAFTNAATTTFTVGTAGSFAVAATGTPAPTLTLTGGTLPAGVTFTSATGELAGTPAPGTGGSYPLTFTAANGVAPNAIQSFTLNVNQAPDTTAPTVTLNQAAGQADPTSASPVDFTVVFSEPVTGFTAADISFTGSTTPGTLTAIISGAGPTYNIAVSGFTGPGTIVASIPAGAATDAAANPSAASTSTDNTVTYRTLQSLPAVVTDNNTFKLRDTLTSGPPTTTFTFGTRTSIPLLGDWDGNGSKTPGSFKEGTFKLSNTLVAPMVDLRFDFGDPLGYPVAGDFDGDGRDDVAVVRSGRWQTRLTASGAVSTFRFGPSRSWPSVVPVAGDWDGDGIDGIGVYNLRNLPTLGKWRLRQTASGGDPQLTFVFGGSGLYPVVGDWDGDGTDGVGTKVWSGSRWRIRETPSAGPPTGSFNYGGTGDLPLTWRS